MSDVERYADLWEDPERYLLIEYPSKAPGDAPRYHWVTAVTFIMATFDADESLRTQIIQRMMAAGVQIISLSQFREMHARPQWGLDDPQHVAPSQPIEAHHVRLADGRFQRVFSGPDRPLFCGVDHILATDELAELLRTTAAQTLNCVPAVIFDPQTGTNRGGYTELRPVHELLPRALRKGMHPRNAEVWHFQREHLFVSPQLCALILKGNFRDLVVTAGFSALVNTVQCDW